MAPSAATYAEAARAFTVLLEIFKENTTHGRHVQTQRQLVTAFILAIAGAILGALGTLHFPVAACKGLGIVLFVFGLIGALFCFVQHGKYVQNRARWQATRDRLEALCPLTHLNKIIAASNPKSSSKRNPKMWLWAGTLPLQWFWISLPLCISVLGLLLLLHPEQFSAWGVK